jgi:uncharacterized iron-regulated membrane protein
LGLRGYVETRSATTPAHLREELVSGAGFAPAGGLLQVFDEGGTLLYQSPGLARHELTTVAPPQTGDAIGFRRAGPEGWPVRMAYQRVGLGGTAVTLEVAEALRAYESSLRSYREWLLLCTPLLALIAGGLGSWIGGRALAPVDRIIAEARAIGARNLSERLSVPPARDELRHLSEALNAMLDRIERLVSRVTQFTAAASHELRAPLALMQMAAEHALRRERSREELTGSLQTVVRETKRTTRLVEDLLLLARSDEGEAPILPVANPAAGRGSPSPCRWRLRPPEHGADAIRREPLAAWRRPGHDEASSEEPLMRKVFFWLHLCAGVAAGLVILIMSVTGVLLTYEAQMIRWADGYRVAPPAPGAPRLGVEALTRRVHDARGAWPSTVTVRAEASAPVEFAYGREGTVFVDPYSGLVLGTGSARARAFFRGVTDWHRWLARSGDVRATGKAVTGASNLVFLFIVLSGLVLWWPGRFTARRLRPITVFVGGLRGKARDFNWHHVFGFWAAIPLVFVVASGVVISYPWANQLLQRVAGGGPAEGGGPPQGGRAEGQRGQRPGPPGAAEGPRGDVSLAGLDVAWANAAAQVPGWQSLSLRLPVTPDAPWSISLDTSSGARRPDTRTQLTLDRTTGATLGVEGHEAVPAGRKAIGWNRFIHTGEAFGLVGQTIAGLASLSAVMLVWTGLALSLRRFLGWRRRSERAAASASPTTTGPSDRAQ